MNNVMSPTAMAAYKGNLAIVEVLVTYGAEVNNNDNNGHLPLHNAASEVHLPIAEMLMQQCVDIHTSMDDGASPLCIASQEGHSGSRCTPFSCSLTNTFTAVTTH